MMSVIMYVGFNRAVLSCDQFLGAPFWWCFIGVAGLDYVLAVERGADLQNPVILRCGVCGGVPGCGFESDGLPVFDVVC